MRFERFKPGELQQISDIRGGKPVLLSARHLHPEPFGECDEWFPKMVIRCHQHTSMPLAERLQISQCLKHIHRVANVVKKDVIEFLVRLKSLPELLLVWKSDREFKGRISLPRDGHDLTTDVDAFAFTRPNDGQKIANVAANRENFFLRFHQKTEKPV